MNEQPSFLEIAFQAKVAKRAIIMAVIVGGILIGINHGNCIVKGDFNSACLLQSVLTFFVPYTVSTVSSVMAIRCHDQSGHDG